MSQYRAGSLTAAARELARCKLDLVSVEEVSWDKGGTVRAGDYNFFSMEKKKNYQFGTTFFVHHRTVSAVKRVEIATDMMLYMVLSGRWFKIIVLNVHAPSEEKSDDSIDRFCVELEQVFIIFLSTIYSIRRF